MVPYSNSECFFFNDAQPAVFISGRKAGKPIDKNAPLPLHSLQPSYDASIPANVFGVELHQLVEKEASGVPIPLIIQKCVAEIECRGLRVRARCPSLHSVGLNQQESKPSFSRAGGWTVSTVRLRCRQEGAQGLV